MNEVIIIDDSLFGHINNDAFLKGSALLQGHSFRRTIGYLQQYIAKQSQPGPIQSIVLLRTLKVLITNCY